MDTRKVEKITEIILVVCVCVFVVGDEMRDRHIGGKGNKNLS